MDSKVTGTCRGRTLLHAAVCPPGIRSSCPIASLNQSRLGVTITSKTSLIVRHATLFREILAGSVQGARIKHCI